MPIFSVFFSRPSINLSAISPILGFLFTFFIFYFVARFTNYEQVFVFFVAKIIVCFMMDF